VENGLGDFLSGRFETVLDLLERYIAEIELFNPLYKLVGTQNRQELIVKHILDSLSGLGLMLPYLDAALPIADAGSGAGLPGVPLAICLPQCRVTLIERMGRRAGFLRNVQAVLGLSNIVIEEMSIEESGANRFNIIAFRAFKPLDEKLLANLSRLLIPGGVLIAYKGRKDAVLREMAAIEPFLIRGELFPIRVPFLDEERHIAVLTPR
jgi:16S rRNA (guanine527-N7)-methyltransferase